MNHFFRKVLLVLLCSLLFPTVASAVWVHTCHWHDLDCYERMMCCGVEQHEHQEQCCSKTEHQHGPDCVKIVPYQHKCLVATDCVTYGCEDHQHHTAQCYVIIDHEGTLCPSYHFDQNGAHTSISCPRLNWEQYILLACLDPKHLDVMNTCEVIYNCAHSKCETSCKLCYIELRCTQDEHIHGDGFCDMSRCGSQHHSSACFQDVLVCEKEEGLCNEIDCMDMSTGTVDLRKAKVEDDEVSVLLLNPDSAVVPLVVCAAYDEQGKMIGTVIKTVPLSDSWRMEADLVEFEYGDWMVGAYSFQLFALEQGTMKPLTAAKTLTE